jgi:hypothetical protein
MAVKRLPNNSHTNLDVAYFVLNKKLEKIDLNLFLYMDLSFRTKASTSQDKIIHIP